MLKKRSRRTFPPEFKKQIIQLYEAGKPRTEIMQEYNLSASLFSKWVKQYQTLGCHREKEWEKPIEAELVRLRFETQHLKWQNDILKLAIQIMGR
ncbi:transposase [Sporosarcina sp. FSL W7-1349]|uniref:transposase n=1 Tax=Sporosarcina sp. FSL W7-1349 TaxID=2921561 RepID=UPI0030F4B5D9